MGWWVVVQVLGWVEPVPDELGIQFSFQYLALQHLCAISAQLLLPLVFVPLLPKGLPGGRAASLVRASIGAGFWYLWTFPLAFLPGMRFAVVLELVRPLLWAVSLAAAVGALRGQGRGLVRWLGVPGLFVGVFLFSLVPDRTFLRHVHMENLRSGMVCDGIPDFPAGGTSVLEWRLQGAPENITAERLRLGNRQTVVGGAPGDLLVRVASSGAIPPPEDTSGTLERDDRGGWFARLGLRRGTEPPGPLGELVAQIPPGSDSLRLLWLHSLVHRSIRYQRTYFPGTPSEILERGSGDCKAFAQVFCAGARRLGIRAKVVHGLLANPDGYYAHAWVTAMRPDGRWMDWDPTSSWPFPDARYLRFTVPAKADGAFEGELAIFSLDSVRAQGPAASR